MKSKFTPIASGLLFALLTVFHILRMVEGWSVYIARHEVPALLSLPAALIFAFMSTLSFRQLLD